MSVETEKKARAVEKEKETNSVIEMMTHDFYENIDLISRINTDLEFYGKYGKKRDKNSIATSMFGSAGDEYNEAFVNIVESMDKARKMAYNRIANIIQMIPYLFQNVKCPFFYFTEKIGEVSCVIVPLTQVFPAKPEETDTASAIASLAIPVDQNIEFKCFLCSVPYKVIETHLEKQ